jgi:hypothetical protein
MGLIHKQHHTPVMGMFCKPYLVETLDYLRQISGETIEPARASNAYKHVLKGDIGIKDQVSKGEVDSLDLLWRESVETSVEEGGLPQPCQTEKHHPSLWCFDTAEHGLERHVMAGAQK